MVLVKRESFGKEREEHGSAHGDLMFSRMAAYVPARTHFGIYFYATAAYIATGPWNRSRARVRSHVRTRRALAIITRFNFGKSRRSAPLCGPNDVCEVRTCPGKCARALVNRISRVIYCRSETPNRIRFVCDLMYRMHALAVLLRRYRTAGFQHASETRAPQRIGLSWERIVLSMKNTINPCVYELHGKV